MNELKMMIVPSPTETRLFARDAEATMTVRATLPTTPQHTHALPRLLIGLGSFVRVRAALVVPSRAPLSATRLYPGWFSDAGGDGYELQIIGGTRREHREWWGR